MIQHFKKNGLINQSSNFMFYFEFPKLRIFWDLYFLHLDSCVSLLNPDIPISKNSDSTLFLLTSNFKVGDLTLFEYLNYSQNHILVSAVTILLCQSILILFLLIYLFDDVIICWANNIDLILSLPKTLPYKKHYLLLYINFGSC